MQARHPGGEPVRIGLFDPDGNSFALATLTRMKLDVYTIVFLRRPADAPALSDEELDSLQRQHLAFNSRMRDEGKAVLTGPLRGQPDESLRGINVFRISVEETRTLMQTDASVRAGRLAFDVCTWLLPEGTLGDRPLERIEVD